jgi:hypothetical protein
VERRLATWGSNALPPTDHGPRQGTDEQRGAGAAHRPTQPSAASTSTKPPPGRGEEPGSAHCRRDRVEQRTASPTSSRQNPTTRATGRGPRSHAAAPFDRGRRTDGHLARLFVRNQVTGDGAPGSRRRRRILPQVEVAEQGLKRIAPCHGLSRMKDVARPATHHRRSCRRRRRGADGKRQPTLVRGPRLRIVSGLDEAPAPGACAGLVPELPAPRAEVGRAAGRRRGRPARRRLRRRRPRARA